MGEVSEKRNTTQRSSEEQSSESSDVVEITFNPAFSPIYEESPSFHSTGMGWGSREFVAPVGRSSTDGAFELDGLAPGSWSVVVRAEGYPEELFEGEHFAPGFSEGHVFRLARGWTLRGPRSPVWPTTAPIG